MKVVKLKIEGMHCDSCVKVIEMELNEQLPGILGSDIDLKTGEAQIKVEDSTDPEKIKEIVNNVGYEAKLEG